jgi:hypothetical protein
MPAAAAELDTSLLLAEWFTVYFFDAPCLDVELYYSDAARQCEPDFVVTLLGEGEQVPQRVPRFVDYSWIYDAGVPQPEWRTGGEDAVAAEERLLGWLEDCYRCRCKSIFEALVGSLSERLAFEYATYLCGIGETSSRPPKSTPTNSVMMRVLPGRAGSSTPSHIRMSIPLLLGGLGAPVGTVKERLIAFLELYDKTLGGLLLAGRGGRQPSSAIQTVHLSYYLAMEVSSSGVVSVSNEKIVMDVSGAADGADLREAVRGAVNLVDSVPRYLTAIQRTSAAQLIDFVPELEEALLSSVFVEPLHFADLVNILAIIFGLPTEVNLLVNRRDGKDSSGFSWTKLNRFAVFTVATADSMCLGASLLVQYEGRDALPLVTLTSAQQTLCTTDRPIRAKVPLNPSALVMHRGATCFDPTAMADAIADSVTERFQLFGRACTASSYPSS